MAELKNFLEELNAQVILGDGAVGTNLLAYKLKYKTCVEHLNLTEPHRVMQLHKDYVTAGSRMIKTNTTGANPLNLDKYGLSDFQGSIIRAGVTLAKRVSGDTVYVAGTVGPLPMINGEPLSESNIHVLFTSQIEYLVENNVDLLLFETFVDLFQLVSAVRIARNIADLPIVAQLAFEMNGKTLSGDAPEEFVSQAGAAGADVIGTNCGAGVSAVSNVIKKIAPYNVPMSAFMNAGFAERIGNRKVYIAPSNYMISKALSLVAQGVRLIGGCCGTTPETISSFVSALKTETTPKRRISPGVKFQEQDTKEQRSPVHVPEIPKGILFELNPPKRFDMKRIIENAVSLHRAGVKAVTLTDNPMASIRVDVLTVAGMIQHAGVPVVVHVTGRDRNRIALQSYLMGAHVLGIRSLLCTTGDPIRMYHETNTTGVFDLTSTGLVKMASDFNAGRRMYGELKTSFAIGVAVNPNARSILAQVEKLKRKVTAGAHFALTQPVFDLNRFGMLQNALKELEVNIPIYIGVMPITSFSLAEYLHNEVPGIQLPVDVLKQLAKYSRPEDQEKIGIDMTVELLEKLIPRVHGIYMTASFNKVETILPILEHITM